MSAALAQEGQPIAQTPAPIDAKQVDTIKSSEETPKPQDEALDPKYAALARREKALRHKALNDRRQLEAERNAFLVEKQAIESERQELQRYRSWKAQLSDDPKSVLDQAGVSYDKLTTQYLNQDPQSLELLEMRKELKALRSEQEQSRSQYQKSQADQYEQAKKQIRTEVSLMVDGDESYEAIRARGDVAKDAAVRLIEKTFEEEGYIIPVEQAVKEIEDYLIEDAFKLSQLKKVQARRQPAPTQSDSDQIQKTQLNQKTQPVSNTLSNRHMPTTKPPTEQERIQRAILRAQGIDPDAVR